MKNGDWGMGLSTSRFLIKRGCPFQTRGAIQVIPFWSRWSPCLGHYSLQWVPWVGYEELMAPDRQKADTAGGPRVEEHEPRGRPWWSLSQLEVGPWIAGGIMVIIILTAASYILTRYVLYPSTDLGAPRATLGEP